MKNEPVAWMQTLQNQDGELKNTVNIEQIGKQDIPLYTHPVKELNDGGEPVKNATYWKRQYNLMATQNDNLKSGLYHANEQIKYLESHPIKELTDEEIDECSCFVDVELSQRYGLIESIDDIDWTITGLRAFARAILKKASEK